MKIIVSDQGESKFKNGLKLLLKIYKNLSDRFVFVSLFMVSFLIRLPFFFRDYIDRDESTFIFNGSIMGRWAFAIHRPLGFKNLPLRFSSLPVLFTSLGKAFW